MIGEGDEAPGFTLPGSDGESIRKYALEDVLASGPAVLVFYPFDFSPVCTDQLCTFRDVEWLTIEEGLDVLGVSVDSAYCHRQFAREYGFQFPLVADRLGNTSARYGLLHDEFEGHYAVPRRAVVAVDASAVVQYTWTPDDQYAEMGRDVVEDAVDWYRNSSA